MILSFALLTGCVGGDFSSYLPTVKFRTLTLQDIDFEQIDVDFVFDVENPNPVDVPLSRFDYALTLEEIEILSGDDPNGLELTAEGTSELALPVALDFGNVYDAVTATRGLDFLGFGLAGGFGFDTDIGPVDIAYDEQGSFPALRMPNIELGRLRLAEADLSNARFELDFDVDNDHGSTLDLSNLDFQVSLFGTRLGAGVLDEVGSVEGATSQTFAIPFDVDYLDAADAVLAAIDGDPVEVDLAATMRVNTPFGEVPLTIDESGNVSTESEVTGE